MQDVVISNGRLRVTESLEVPLAEMKEALQVQEADGSKRARRVIIEAIHEGVTRNYHEFTAENLKKAVKSWTTPYKKPVLKDHMTSGVLTDAPAPLGRVQSAKLVPSALKQGVVAHQLELLITDPEAIERIDDGRYLTLSVGASVEEVYCSICGNELLRSRSLWGHEHERGKKYKGKTATWVLAGIQFDEVSFVNVPADPHAQILSVMPDDGAEANESAATEEVSQELEDREDQVKVLESLDELAGVNEGDEADSSDDATEAELQGSESDEPADDKAKEDTDLSELLRPIQEGLASVQADVQLANEAIAELFERITDLESKYDELVKQAGETQQALLAQNVELAKFARQQMAERLADLTYLTGECQADEWDEIYQEALTLKSKDLATRLKEALQDAMASGPRPIARVEPQGLASKTKFDVSESEELPEEKEPTLNDLANAFINRLSSYKR